MAQDDAERPLVTPNPPNWGSIHDVVNGPLIDVADDESWISAFGMWLFLPLVLLQAALVPCFRCLYVLYCLGFEWLPGSKSCGSVLGSVLQGRPLYLAWVWWRSVASGLLLLMSQGKSRLGLFLWEKDAMGEGGPFWQGEGIWSWRYSEVDAMLRSQQARRPAFACIRACMPDLYATNILIFLPNAGPDSEWWAIRNALHGMFLDVGLPAYRARAQRLPGLLASAWRSPKFEDFEDLEKLRSMVSRCVIFIMFGTWIDEEDAKVLTGWRSDAFFFILPRLVQRFLFNLGIKKVKQLRVDTVGIVEKYGLQHVFVAMNNSLPPKYRRQTVVKLCDEIMYVVGFAGIGGTSAACETVGALLQGKLPDESPGPKYVDFGQYNTSAKMVAKYNENPERYIREALRLLPPVTSATTSLKQETKVTMAGQQLWMPKGLLNQYVLSIANRDEGLFPNSSLFDPDRRNLEKAFTWNGAFGSADESQYPRICPGRHLSLEVIKIVVGHVVHNAAPLKPA